MENNIKINEDTVILNINPKLYSLETVYSAAYVFLDRAYILLDGDPKEKIVVKLKPKKEENLEKDKGYSTAEDPNIDSIGAICRVTGLGYLVQIAYSKKLEEELEKYKSKPKKIVKKTVKGKITKKKKLKV